MHSQFLVVDENVRVDVRVVGVAIRRLGEVELVYL